MQMLKLQMLPPSLKIPCSGGQLLAASGGNSAAVIHTTSHGQALLHVVDAVLSPVAISGTSGVEDLTWSYKVRARMRACACGVCERACVHMLTFLG